jgi:predicted esterase
MSTFRLLAVALAFLPQLSVAQGGPVTRRDLADAYLQIDRLAMTRGIPDAQRADWNRDFDRTTLAFFSGDFPRVLRQMHDLTARMVGDSAPNSPTRQLLGLRLRVTPRVLVSDGPALRLTLTVMYADTSARQARRVSLRMLRADGSEIGAPVLEIPADAAAGSEFSIELALNGAENARGSLMAEATLPDAQVVLRAPFFVMNASADSTRVRLSRLADAVELKADPQTRASLRARLTLLTDTPDEANSAQFLADPVALSDAIQEEIAAIEAGRDPYRRTGDLWRVLRMPGGEVPMRVYVPPQARSGRALPVVIALHGAGADENMFLEGYGAGRLRTLADSAGFVLISPLTTAFVRERGTLDSALALVARSATIDRARVYVIGHSMGGAATIKLASESREQVRAAVVIAGVGTLPAGARLAPTLFIGAEHDLVIPVTRVRVTYDQLLAAGAPVEYEQANGWGHTLIVGAHLERAVHWLWQR